MMGIVSQLMKGDIEAARAHASDPKESKETWVHLCARALVRMDEGDVPGAIGDAGEAVRLCGGHHVAHVIRARALAADHGYGEAEDEYLRRSSFRPEAGTSPWSSPATTTSGASGTPGPSGYSIRRLQPQARRGSGFAPRRALPRGSCRRPWTAPRGSRKGIRKHRTTGACTPAPASTRNGTATRPRRSAPCRSAPSTTG